VRESTTRGDRLDPAARKESSTSRIRCPENSRLPFPGWARWRLPHRLPADSRRTKGKGLARIAPPHEKGGAIHGTQAAEVEAGHDRRARARVEGPRRQRPRRPARAQPRGVAASPVRRRRTEGVGPALSRALRPGRLHGSGLAHVGVEEFRRERPRARRAPHPRREHGAGDHRLPGLLHGARRKPVHQLERHRRVRRLPHQELVPFIDREFRTLASRDHRGCFGKSSGGYGAIIHGMRYSGRGAPSPTIRATRISTWSTGTTGRIR
jgi:hypothetical protein